ncbi:Smr/MutS family protein [Gemmatimonadota bacterium]
MSTRRRKNHKKPLTGVADPLFDSRPVAVLDLHHYAASEVEGATCSFILTWQKRASGSVVHIVTGKGRRSDGAPVLKPRVRQILNTQLRAAIKDWTKDVDDGGFLVLLR